MGTGGGAKGEAGGAGIGVDGAPPVQTYGVVWSGDKGEMLKMGTEQEERKKPLEVSTVRLLCVRTVWCGMSVAAVKARRSCDRLGRAIAPS